MPTHHETRILPYQPAQLLALVGDVAAYPEFLPWCRGARIRKTETVDNNQLVIADLIIGFKGITERFTSRVLIQPDQQRIDTSFEEGPFRYLKSYWIFTAEGEGASRVEFFVDFEFRSKLLQSLIGLVFGEAVRRMVQAFEKRAAVLFPAENC